jgi:putative peptidoglycan lipid II flippase
LIKALLLSSLALNLGLLLGRLSGFVREAFLASAYGATAEADVIIQMLTIPDLLVSVLMGGAMGAMLVPEFAQNPKKALQLLYQSCLFFGLIFFFVAAGLYWHSDILVRVIAPGFTGDRMEKAALGLGWVVWLIPLTVLSGVVTAFLHAKNKFGVAALGTLIINSAIILGLLLVSSGYGTLYLIAILVLIGGLLRLLSQVLLVRPRWNPVQSLREWRLRKPLLIRYGQAMLSGSALLLFPVVARALASYEDEGSVAIFNYASRLVEFPLTIAVTFLAVVLFPRLAQSFANDQAYHQQLVRSGVQITLGLSVVAGTTLIILSEQYADFVYGHGKMDKASLSSVTTLLMIGLLTLPLQGMTSFLTAVFNARKNTKTPLLLNATGLTFFCFTNSVDLFGEGLSALMWGIVVSYGFIFCLQIMFLRVAGFRWRDTILNVSFCLGGLVAIAISAVSSLWIAGSNFPVWFSMVLAVCFAFISLAVMALFNHNVRQMLKTKMMAQ